MSAKTNALEAAKKALPNNVIIATIPKAEEPQKPIGNLKPTPEMPMDFQTKLNCIKRLEALESNLRRYETTKVLLSGFKLEEGPHQSASLVIKDSGYNGPEFKTGNVEVIKEVVAFMENVINIRIEGIMKEIAAFELPKI